MRYYIIAGEASGDLHAGNLMKGIYEEDRQAVIRFRGGSVMEEAFVRNLAEQQKQSRADEQEQRRADEQKQSRGRHNDRDVNAVSPTDGGKAFDYREGAVMGVFELAGRLPSLLRNISECKKDILSFKPDVLILVDYPGFNLRIAKWAHRKGIRVFWYIAPKVWASREWRIKSIRKYVDKLFIVFPFEQDYFTSKGVPYIYCGNPLVDAVEASTAMTSDRDALRRDLCGGAEGSAGSVPGSGAEGSAGSVPGSGAGSGPGSGAGSGKIVALLAGSRAAEVKTMMPLFKEVIAIMDSSPQTAGCRYIIAGAPGRKEEDYGQFDRSRISLVFGRTQEILRAADAAVVNSGTASLEAALLGTPQVVAYKVASRLTYLLGKYLLFKAKYISLGNLCLDSLVFRELYKQEGGEDDCTPQNVAAELKRLLTDTQYRNSMLDGYAKIRASLGEGGSSRRVAGAIVREIIGRIPERN